jgi:hypothetical protein
MRARGVLHFSGPRRGAAGDMHSYRQLFLHHSYLGVRSRNVRPEQVSSSASIVDAAARSWGESRKSLQKQARYRVIWFGGTTD